MTAIAVGYGNFMALTSAGKVVAWGSATQTPASLAGATITAIAAGNGFDLALTSTGDVVGWGNDYSGQADPPASLNGQTVSAIAAGDDHSLASVAPDGRPTFSRHLDVNVPATSASGRRANYALPTATDVNGRAVPVSCAPVSGSSFPIGDTPVMCSATDQDGLTSTSTFVVHVLTPTVEALSRGRVGAGGGQTVTIYGHGFSGTRSVTFGGTPAASFHVDSGHQITTVTPAHPVGPADIEVTTFGGTAGTSPPSFPLNFDPVITDISPTVGPVTGGTKVVVTGAGFTGAIRAALDGVTSPVTVVSDRRVTLVTPPGQPGHTGPLSLSVIVQTSSGEDGGSIQLFSYAPTPAVSVISPMSGGVDGGTRVRITGSGFTGAHAVDFGAGASSSMFRVDSDTQIVAVAPAHVAGPVNVRVATDGGISPVAAGDRYLYTGG